MEVIGSVNSVPQLILSILKTLRLIYVQYVRILMKT